MLRIQRQSALQKAESGEYRNSPFSLPSDESTRRVCGVKHMLLVHLHKMREQDLGPFIKGLNSNLIFNLKLTLYS